MSRPRLPRRSGVGIRLAYIPRRGRLHPLSIKATAARKARESATEHAPALAEAVAAS